MGLEHKRSQALLRGRKIRPSAQDIAVYFGRRLYLTALFIECGLGHERRQIFGIRVLIPFESRLLGGHKFLRIFIQGGQSEKFLGVGSLRESQRWSSAAFCIASRASFTFPKL